MWYAIIAEDFPGSLENRRQARPAHLARLQLLLQQGRLLVAGPHPKIDSQDPGPAGFSGSLVIAEFNNIEDAKIWAESDPYHAAGVYQKITVKPFNKVLP